MSVLDRHVLSQCLSQLPLEDYASPILDYRKQKLSTVGLLKIFITAQLMKWESLGFIEQVIRSEEELQHEFGVASISKSQLSRRINDLPVDVTASLFQCVVRAIQARTAGKWARSAHKMAIVDSTSLRMPPLLGDWAYVSNKQCGVKVHTRLVVIDKDALHPDSIVPSTGNVSDYKGADLLVVDKDVLYVMDRGYVCYKRMQQWASGNMQFVIRLSNHHFATVVRDKPLPADDQRITRDAIVLLGNQPKTTMTAPVRLIEFEDEQGRFYRLATTRFDLAATELLEIYRHRWLIELFFKWLKQHVKLDHLYSYQPTAVWNHIFLAYVAFGLVYLMKLSLQTSLSDWHLALLIRTYACKRWSRFCDELSRRPARSSRGRGKTRHPPDPIAVHDTDGVLVAQPKKRNR